MDDRDGIEAAIKGFLCMGGGLEHSTGILKEWLQAQAFLDAVPGGFDSAQTSVSKLEVVSLDGERAVVDLDANRRWTATDLAGKPHSGSDHFTGPVELIRTDDGWQVNEIVRDGVSLRQSTFRSSLSVTFGDLSVRALMGRYDGSTLRVVFEASYGGSTPVGILGYDVAIRNVPFRWTWASRSSLRLT